MPGPVRNVADLERELSKLTKKDDKLLLYYGTLAAVFPLDGWQGQGAQREARELAQRYNCVIDEYPPEKRTVVFRKL